MFVCDPICAKYNYLTLKIYFVWVSMYIIFKYFDISTNILWDAMWAK